MTVGIVGAGGVGGFLASVLAKEEEKVYLLARERHVAVIEKEGILLQGNEGRLRAKPTAVASKAQAFGQKMDVVIFATKGYDLETVVKEAAAMIDTKTLLLPLGNGVGNAALLTSIYPDNPVANGAIYIVSHLKAPGYIRLMGRGAKIVMGMVQGDSEHLPALAEVMGRAGIKTILSDDITTDMWRKYLLISAMGTLTSCYDAPMGAIVAHHRDALQNALEEIVAVGIREGARLGKEDIEGVITQLGRVPFDAPTSMWLDFQRGGKTELEQLTGYVVKKAAIHGLTVPTMTHCYEELKKRMSVV